MAVSQARSLLVLAAIATIFSLIGSSVAQDAPAPAPASSAGVALPSLAVAVVSFLFGSAAMI
ncbi:hypothetical protein CASFOL_011140 [Castilleja foliolosa]|uniref:Uncharacterized protein n=1 Tax=Castilleja foliolosa TaxID=1961234 RepID=A0ABD3DUN0_9LAMI